MVRKSSPWESLRDASDTFPFIKAKEREFGTYIRGEHSGVKKKSRLASWILGKKIQTCFFLSSILLKTLLLRMCAGKQKSKGPSL